MRLLHYINESSINGEIIIKKPSKCTKDEINTFYDLVREAGHAFPSLNDIKKKAFLLGFYYLGNEIIAISSLKIPYRIDDVFDEAGVDSTGYKYEMGWSYTIPEYQAKGIMFDLNMALLNKVQGKVFATVRVNNEPSIKGLIKKGFVKVGNEWQGMVTKLALYVRK